MGDLTESALLDALARIKAAPPATPPRGLIVTEAGIQLWLTRFETEPEFRENVRKVAVDDAGFRDFVVQLIGQEALDGEKT